ncbi:MAG TPA: DUF6340 family protein [Prolixibacteraceae bacterium]|nr:DUF6340 family protein [Prolixibacteraceae bacterium]
MKNNSFLLTLLAVIGLSSCSINSNMGSLKVETVKPGLFSFLEHVDTIAIFKRDFYQSDTNAYKYLDVENNKILTDSLIRYADLSNKCVDALADYLNQQGHFLKVINFRDTMNHLFSGKENTLNYQGMAEKLGVDMCMSLDFFHLKDKMMNNNFYFSPQVLNEFPEFMTATAMECIESNLLWTLSFRGDTSLYISKEKDELYYGNSVNPELFGGDRRHKILLENVAGYFGESFAKKFIPSEEQTERLYYKSKNPSMLQAEKYFVDGDLIKAAEIYKRQTKSKNPDIAAKATYNMALICELEGNLPAASDWLYQSTYVIQTKNPVHQMNCTDYNTILAKRRRHVAVLDRQIKINESKAEN